jgi:adenylate cyclase class IV
MANYEIEIKCLLGTKENAEALLEKMKSLDSEMHVKGTNSQLNHYFMGGDEEQLYALLVPFFKDQQEQAFREILEKGKDFSLRTRQKDEEVLLVIKAALDGGTSANTVSRLEFEEAMPITLPELDALLEAAGFTHQAKWSRERVEYAYKDITVCLDKNAGYGYLAEFETVTEDEASLPQVRENLMAKMAELGVTELPQDRLARMFAYYNENWPEYYGTDKTFNIE